MKKELSQRNNLTARLVMTALLGAWFACLFVESFLGEASFLAPEFVHGMAYLWFVGSWIVLFGLLLLYGSLSPATVKWFSLGSCALYCLRAAFLGGSYYLTFALCGVLAAMWILCGVEVPTQRRPLSRRGAIIALSVIGIIGFAFMLAVMVMDYRAYLTPSTGSTGLYSQMLWSMRETFGQGTTLEFGEAGAHWAAHISPIFYLYLPFFAIIPSPVTLMVLQCLAVTSAIIPLFLIARRHGLSRGVAVILSSIALLLPAVMGGTMGGLHELALLFPLLLWLLWALEKGHTPLVAVLAVLCLCVRETAALYVFTVGLYRLLSHGSREGKDAKAIKKDRLTAIVLMAVSVCYLVVSLALLTNIGQGTLITRYENVTGVYNTDFWTLIWEILMNPAIILHEMWSASKLHFLLCLLLPLGLLPLLCRRKARLVCLIPLVLINLLPDASYQYSIDFPYGFGVAALALYLSVIALADRRADQRTERRVVTGDKTTQAQATLPCSKRLLTLTVCCAMIVSAFFVGHRCSADLTYAVTAGDEISAIDSVLEAVPADASVSASGHLIPHLAGRAEIYRLSTEADTAYIVLDLREAQAVKGEDIYDVDHYKELGYTVVAQKDGIAAVLKKG